MAHLLVLSQDRVIHLTPTELRFFKTRGTAKDGKIWKKVDLKRGEIAVAVDDIHRGDFRGRVSQCHLAREGPFKRLALRRRPAVRGELGGLVEGKLRVRADTFGYLQRSFHGLVSEVDAKEAREVGRMAVRIATSGEVPHGSVILRREEGPEYAVTYDWCELEKGARETKEMPPEFLKGTNDVTASFLEYVRPLVGQLPVHGRLSDHPVPRRG